MTHPAATPWLFVDFDNTLMGTDAIAIPPLIARINHLYHDKLPRPMTMEDFSANFQGIGGKSLCIALGAYYGFAIDYETLFAGREESVTNYFRQVGVMMAPHLIEAFTDLRDAHGMRFALVSNNMVQRCLSAMRFASDGRGEDLARFFGTHFFEAGAVQKPDPSVYLRAMNFSNADPAQSYAVEDSATGVKAAVAAGMTTFGFLGFADHPDTREQELLSHGAVACFRDWADFPPLWRSHANPSAKTGAA